MKNKLHLPQGNLKSEYLELYREEPGSYDGSGAGKGCGYRTGLSEGSHHANYLFYYLSNNEYKPRPRGDCDPDGKGVT